MKLLKTMHVNNTTTYCWAYMFSVALPRSGFRLCLILKISPGSHTFLSSPTSRWFLVLTQKRRSRRNNLTALHKPELRPQSRGNGHEEESLLRTEAPLADGGEWPAAPFVGFVGVNFTGRRRASTWQSPGPETSHNVTVEPPEPYLPRT